VAVGANRDPQVKEDKAVDVSVACPAQGPPSVEAVEECVPGEVVVGLWFGFRTINESKNADDSCPKSEFIKFTSKCFLTNHDFSLSLRQ
jgi:hypothetical protein